MKIRENHFRCAGRYCLWLTPSIILSGTKYDNPGEYEKWFQVEFFWLFWVYTLWIDYKKNKQKENK